MAWIPRNQQESGELLYERDLVHRIAVVRLVLTIANVGVIWLDRSVPSVGTATAYTWAFAAAGAFIAYATTLLIILRRKAVSSLGLAVASPILDVFLSALLILSTDGYLSPFNLWLVFAVVSAGCSRYRLLPFATAILAVGAHVLIATIPQAQPLDVTVFAVRTGYLFGVAAVLTAICTFLMGQSAALSMIEEAGREFAAAISEYDVLQLLTQRLMRDVGCNHVTVHSAQREFDQRQHNYNGPSKTIVLQANGQVLAEVVCSRDGGWNRTEDTVARVLCDRASSSLLRARVSEQLRAAAALNERLRVTDELHDTTIQSLAAVDLRLEAARIIAAQFDPDLAKDLGAIKGIARTAATQFRNALVAQEKSVRSGSETVRALLTERWTGRSTIFVDSDMHLTPAQWKAVEDFARAGLSNASKHGQAKHVCLQVRLESDGQVVCLLEDDGPPLRSPVTFGYGLRRLAELTQEIGATLRLEPNEPRGARLRMEFPATP